jgi:hypothetical protein
VEKVSAINRGKQAREAFIKKDFTRIAKETKMTLGKRLVKVADCHRLH